MEKKSFSPIESDEKGRYDIFTADKAGTYLIFVWVKFSGITNDEVALNRLWSQRDRNIKKKKANETEIFFSERVKLPDSGRISIYFKSTHTDSRFYVCEVWPGWKQTVCMQAT